MLRGLGPSLRPAHQHTFILTQAACTGTVRDQPRYRAREYSRARKLMFLTAITPAASPSPTDIPKSKSRVTPRFSIKKPVPGRRRMAGRTTPAYENEARIA